MNNLRVVIIGGVVLVLCLCVSGVFAVAMFSVSQDNATYGALAEACQGSGVAAAAEYSEDSGVHPAVGMKSYTGASYSTYNYAIPDQAVAKGVADAQLVLCVEEEKKELLESCPYEDEDDDKLRVVERYGYEVKVTLVEAKTGKVIEEETLNGEEPRECKDVESFRESQTTVTLDGENVDTADMQQWVRPYVIIP